MQYSKETLHQALASHGFSSTLGSEKNVSGKRMIFNEMTGAVVGWMNAQEGWDFIHSIRNQFPRLVVDND